MLVISIISSSHNYPRCLVNQVHFGNWETHLMEKFEKRTVLLTFVFSGEPSHCQTSCPFKEE